jgi:hypothetical protein
MHCSICRRELSDQEPIYVVWVGSTIWAQRFAGRSLRACTNCKERPPEGMEWAFVKLEKLRLSASLCHHCNRPVFVNRRKGRRYIVCSDRCREAVYNANARRWHRRPVQKRPCAVCGELFTPKRADALYCSPACKQKAYRRGRRNAQGAPSAEPVADEGESEITHG